MVALTYILFFTYLLIFMILLEFKIKTQCEQTVDLGNCKEKENEEKKKPCYLSDTGMEVNHMVGKRHAEK